MLTLISPEVLFWLVALVGLLIFEGVTAGLVSIWFAGGALAALIAAGVGGAIWLQVVLFLVVSAGLLALLRPLIKDVIRPKKVATNVDRHLGKTALVTEEINNLHETGAVKLDGVVWTARGIDSQIIPVGSTITVHRIEGVKLIVELAQMPTQV